MADQPAKPSARVDVVYRKVPIEDVSTWDRARLEAECDKLLKEITGNGAVVQLIRKILPDLSKSNNVAQEAQRVAVLRSIVPILQACANDPKYTGDMAESCWRAVNTILYDKERYCSFPQLLPLLNDNNIAVLNDLVAVCGNCEASAKSFALLVRYAAEEPRKLRTLANWKELFRRPRKKIAGMSMLPESHDDKLRMSPRRLLPTATAEYIDDEKLAATASELDSLLKNDSQVTDPLKLLVDLRSRDLSVGAYAGYIHPDRWQALYDKEAVDDKENIDQLWSYMISILTRYPEKASTMGKVLRQLWPGLTQVSAQVDQWEATLAGYDDNTLDQLGGYLSCWRHGLSVAEVQAVIGEAETLGNDGVAIMSELRSYCGGTKLLTAEQEVSVARWNEYAKVVENIPKVISSTETDGAKYSPQTGVYEVVKSFRMFEKPGDNIPFILPPACIEYIGRTFRTKEDVEVMKVVCTVYRNFEGNETDLDALVVRLRRFDRETFRSIVMFFRDYFSRSGVVHPQVMTLVLDSVEKHGTNATYLLHKTEHEWHKRTSGTDMYSLDPKALNILRELLVDKIHDGDSCTPEMIEQVSQDIARANLDAISLAQVQDCLAQVKQNRRVVGSIALKCEKQGPTGISWSDNLALLTKVYQLSDECQARIHRLAQTDFQTVAAWCHPDPEATLYRDFVESAAYDAHPDLLSTVLAYNNLWLGKARTACKAQNRAAETTSIGKRFRTLIGSLLKKRPPSQAPAVVPMRKLPDLAIEEAHALADKLTTKVAAVHDSDKKALVLLRMTQIANEPACKDPELFDYFLSIADDGIFHAMYASQKAWQKDSATRDQFVACFKECPLLAEEYRKFENCWDMLFTVRDICRKENGVAIASALLKNVGLSNDVQTATTDDVHAFESAYAAVLTTQQPNHGVNGLNLEWPEIVGRVLEAIIGNYMWPFIKQPSKVAAAAQLVSWVNENPARLTMLVTILSHDVAGKTTWHFEPTTAIMNLLRLGQDWGASDAGWFQKELPLFEMAGLVTASTRERLNKALPRPIV